MDEDKLGLGAPPSRHSHPSAHTQQNRLSAHAQHGLLVLSCVSPDVACCSQARTTERGGDDDRSAPRGVGGGQERSRLRA
eukprot:2298443-Rhodomonas_salina.1